MEAAAARAAGGRGGSFSRAREKCTRVQLQVPELVLVLMVLVVVQILVVVLAVVVVLLVGLVVVVVLEVVGKNGRSAAGCKEVEAVLKEVKQQGQGEKKSDICCNFLKTHARVECEAGEAKITINRVVLLNETGNVYCIVHKCSYVIISKSAR